MNVTCRCVFREFGCRTVALIEPDWVGNLSGVTLPIQGAGADARPANAVCSGRDANDVLYH
jgi:hypothetical protein